MCPRSSEPHLRLIVVAGFLGSGKTTVLLEIARHLVAAGRKVAVIENEIGEVGIDGRYFAEQGLVVKELFGGCICCTLAIGVVDALKTIGRTYDPDYVLLEPSGIARPGDVIATVDQYASDIDDVAVVTLIDVERFDVFLEVLGPMLEGQVARANVIALNKVDTVSPEQVERILSAVRTLAPAVPVVAVSALDRESLASVVRVVL